ncbi:MAG: hypothetical protein JNK53_04115 [Phycisphaerae bacterium]|nr:hypothetical protein [Phycisphaerae bacterium]
MRTRIAIGAVIGTVVAFFYGFVTWAVIGLWDGKIQSLPPQHDIGRMVASEVLTDGAYFFPSFDTAKSKALRASGTPEDAAAADAMDEAYEVVHRAGPIGMVIIRKEGLPVMGAGTFACSIGFDVICASLMAFFIAATACPRWVGRWMYGVMIAAFAALAANGANASWFHFPANFVLYDIADLFLKWTLVSAAIALVVSPAPPCPFHAATPKPQQA